ncbi:CLUMA_CG015639, isoform A [Clunio marinus]|uniref:CLUMA_CG015639, isoform A n=1 Tax=Clunio marinus TaxID=568069 RepID=A0A1J1IQC1_9DIPT|nr:CLUMA_CG015639, isoform A [Clunio marinus]
MKSKENHFALQCSFSFFSDPIFIDIQERPINGREFVKIPQCMKANEISSKESSDYCLCIYLQKNCSKHGINLIKYFCLEEIFVLYLLK